MILKPHQQTGISVVEASEYAITSGDMLTLSVYVNENSKKNYKNNLIHSISFKL